MEKSGYKVSSFFIRSSQNHHNKNGTLFTHIKKDYKSLQDFEERDMELFSSNAYWNNRDFKVILSNKYLICLPAWKRIQEIYMYKHQIRLNTILNS
jgi:hypothetical protein